MSAPTEEKEAARTEDNQRVGWRCECVGLMGESGAVMTGRTGWKLTLMSVRGAAPNKGQGRQEGAEKSRGTVGAQRIRRGAKVQDGGPEERREARRVLRARDYIAGRGEEGLCERPGVGCGAGTRGRGGATGTVGAAPASAVAVETVVAAGRRLESPLLRGASLLAAL